MRKVDARVPSYIFSLVYFSLCAVSFCEAAKVASGAWQAAGAWTLAATYGAFGLGAAYYLFKRPVMPHVSADLRLSLKAQKTLRCLVLALPLPVVAVWGHPAILGAMINGSGALGEGAESIRQYQVAQGFYQLVSNLHARTGGVKPYDEATLGSICDKQNKFYEADCHYQRAERLLAEHHAGDPFCMEPRSAQIPEVHGRAVIALPRMLRLLSTVPKSQAIREFDFAEAALQRQGESSLSLGITFLGLDMRPIVRDYRHPPEGGILISQTLQDSASTVGPQGDDATVISGVNTAGCCITGDEITRHLRNIPIKQALAEFSCAENFYPGSKALHVHEDFSSFSPQGSFLTPKCARDLIPRTIAIMESPEYYRLLRLGTTAGKDEVTELNIVISEYKPAHRLSGAEIIWFVRRAKDYGLTAHVDSVDFDADLSKQAPNTVSVTIQNNCLGVYIKSFLHPDGSESGTTRDESIELSHRAFEALLRAIEARNQSRRCQ